MKELAESHIGHVVQQELGVDVSIESGPIVISEVVAHHRDIHGRFIAFLYRCVLQSLLSMEKHASGSRVARHGQWMWHDHCPDNIIVQHEMYLKYLGGTTRA